MIEVKEGRKKAVLIHWSAFLISIASNRKYNGKAPQRLRCGVFIITTEAKKQKQITKRTSASSSEKAMAPHSSTLAWKILWMEEAGGLQSMGSRRVRHD